MEHRTNAEIPCIFEISPPRKKWACCSISTYHIPQTELSYLHYHSDMELGLCTHGSGTLYLNGKAIPYSAGDVQIILPRQPHINVTSVPDTIWHFLSFSPTKLKTANLKPDPEFLKKISTDYKINGVFCEREHPETVRLLSELALFAIKQPSSPYDEDLLLMHLLSFLMQTFSAMPAPASAPTEMNLQTDKIMPALVSLFKAQENGKFLTITEMAEACHFSPSYFRKLFFDTMGKTPKAYLLEEQLKFAAQLLLTSQLPISEIQMQAGFSNASVFYRQFVRQFGCSPSAFRKQKSS